MLNIQSLTMQFGGLIAVQEVSLEVNKGEIIGLIGPNGAGKTTLFNCITGIYKPTSGHIELVIDGHTHNITNALPYHIIRWGMARTFQNVRLFQELTVLENVLIGLHSRLHSGFFHTIFRNDVFLKEEHAAVEKAYTLLEYFDLDTLADTQVNALPFGRQKVLEIARALMSGPQLLLLDEPVAGLNTNETETLMTLIRKIKDEFDLSILLIEHDMSFVMSLCERIYVMDHGELIAVGNPNEVKTNQQVITAYLGEAAV